MKIAVLGATGMLGTMLVDFFAALPDFQVVATVRNAKQAEALRTKYPAVSVNVLNAETATPADIERAVTDSTWVLNAIGLIKQRIKEDDPGHVERAVLTNARFPFTLAHAALSAGFRVIQVATDCVYSGTVGGYDELSYHDCTDVYGKTKSLGEIRGEYFYNIRCSIIGPETHNSLSLLSWFPAHPDASLVNGYVNHNWNGVTTLHFAKICLGLVRNTDTFTGRTQHVVPLDFMSKYELLRSFSRVFSRTDISIIPVSAPTAIDRTLSTIAPAANAELWDMAGYSRAPSVEDMVIELGQWLSDRRKQ